MTRYLLIGVVLAILILPYTQPTLRMAAAGDREDVKLLVTTFFDYLKSGDTNGILTCLTEPMLSERKELLIENPNYSGFLKKIYQHRRIVLRELKVIDDYTMVVSVEITKSDNQVRNTSFLCRKDNGLWKISEELRSN